MGDALKAQLEPVKAGVIGVPVERGIRGEPVNAGVRGEPVKTAVTCSGEMDNERRIRPGRIM